MSAEQAAQAAEKRKELIEKLADVDEELGELFLMEEAIDEDVLRGAIRRATTSLAFVPIFMGSAYKNKGVQLLLDGVTDYLPAPSDVGNTALVRTCSLWASLCNFSLLLGTVWAGV
jgi:elongation factor G